jgi:trehalose 6-phosphate phosphatase
MNPIMSENNLGVLDRFGSARALVAFDYDGTLAPIVADRDRALMRQRTRLLLDEVTRYYPSAVISGRGRDDVIALLDGISVKHVVGNHGIEPADAGVPFEHDVAVVLPELQAALREKQGIEIENKRYSLSIHYRKSKNNRDAAAAIHAAIAGLSRPMRPVLGELVVNIIPAGAPHKGDALARLRAQECADIALFVGDDVTDEDVFELNAPEWLVCVRVAHSETSAAPWYLRNQLEMDSLLEKLVDLRKCAT